ncbi:uncharacterized protein LOC131649805 [Vicia villosa]|uniref:uncharacterized protein LOC131649805 n=1 Tax=Vicia villosa TaxID=3911 RepID=UPI00273CF1D0|nr:uncharacterized protein LOC131649805 [Vicia villosa]
MSRVQLLTAKFENLRMKENESIHDFHMNIVEIANASSALGEKISYAKLVKKILRSLPKRFDIKVAAIKEAQDLKNMKVDELMGSLHTLEPGFGKNSKKSIAFVSNPDSTKVSNVKNKPLDISNNQDVGRRSRTEDRSYQGKGVQCHECEGYGNIKAECPTYLKRKKKSLDVSWSEDDSESDTKIAKYVIALAGVCDEESDCEEITFKELATSYKELCLRSEKVCQQVEDQNKAVAQLQDEKVKHLSIIFELKSQVVLLNSQLDNMNKSVRMQNSSSDVLDEILQSRNNVGNIKIIVKAKEKWIPKTVVSALIAHTSLRASTREHWCFDSGCEVTMKENRSKDNCYLWSPQEVECSTCLMTNEDEAKLWHQNLGYLHLKGMKKVLSSEAVRGIPKLKIDEERIFGECQIGKLKSLGGKKYAYVVVDDFSRFTWLSFIREKSDGKSTSGGCFFLGNNPISWFSKKHNCVSLSTVEAEYIAAGCSCSQLVWMKKMLYEYNVS